MSESPEGGRLDGQGENPDRIVLAGIQRRIEYTFYWLLVPLFFLAGRLVQLQAFPSAGASSIALKPGTFVRHIMLPAQRGQILAADGTALAVTLDEYNICANPRGWNATANSADAVRADKEKVAATIEQAVGGDVDRDLAALARTTRADGKPNRFVILDRRVDEPHIEKLRQLMGPPSPHETRVERTARQKLWAPISLPATPHREYPLGNFASQLIGFVTNTGHGADGLEQAWDHELAGTPGEVVSQVDARNRPVPGFVKSWVPPITGRTVVTTIDPQIQADTDAELNTLVQKFHPQLATAIVMRPRTGEIVALSTAPTFDLNARPKNIVDLATNRCLSYAYEPGSTFKIITASATVETVPNWQNISFTINPAEQVGKHIIHDWNYWTGHRETTVKTLSDGIRDSSNICMYHFARLVGAPKMLEYARRFGVGVPVHLAGLHEHPGLLPRNKPSQWSPEQLANFSFGQGMLLTPLQLVRIAATIANDGVMMKPMLIKELRDEQGRVLQSFGPVVDHRVVAVETAHQVRAMMMRVTSEGTARRYVYVPGYATAGKTGSAQKADGKRGYAEGKFISSFVGFVPALNPQFVILIMADEPHGSHWGSEVCGPAFANIATRAMLHLRLREGTAAPSPSPELMTRPRPEAG